MYWRVSMSFSKVMLYNLAKRGASVSKLVFHEDDEDDEEAPATKDYVYPKSPPHDGNPGGAVQVESSS